VADCAPSRTNAPVISHHGLQFALSIA